jgi:hypothetical protein
MDPLLRMFGFDARTEALDRRHAESWRHQPLMLCRGPETSGPLAPVRPRLAWDSPLRRLLVLLGLPLLFGGLGGGSLTAPPALVFAGHDGLSPARQKCRPETTIPQEAGSPAGFVASVKPGDLHSQVLHRPRELHRRCRFARHVGRFHWTQWHDGVSGTHTLDDSGRY